MSETKKKVKVKRGRGQPRKIPNTEAGLAKLEKQINDFFADCDTKGHIYTLSGLAYYLDMDRKTLLNYSKDQDYFPTIRKARRKVELAIEQRLLSEKGGATGAIFNLKNNFGWKDETIQDVTHKGINISLTKFDHE